MITNVFSIFPSTLFLNAELHVAFLEEKKEVAAVKDLLRKFRTYVPLMDQILYGGNYGTIHAPSPPRALAPPTGNLDPSPRGNPLLWELEATVQSLSQWSWLCEKLNLPTLLTEGKWLH